MAKIKGGNSGLVDTKPETPIEEEKEQGFNILAKPSKPQMTHFAGNIFPQEMGKDSDAFRKFSVATGRHSIINDKLTKDDFHEGIMKKQRPSRLFNGFQVRYFVLSNRMLKYYKT